MVGITTSYLTLMPLCCHHRHGIKLVMAKVLEAFPNDPWQAGFSVSIGPFAFYYYILEYHELVHAFILQNNPEKSCVHPKEFLSHRTPFGKTSVRVIRTKEVLLKIVPEITKGDQHYLK